MEERRTLPRHPLTPRLLCRLHCPELPAPALGVAHDVSARGIGLFLNRPLQPGESVWLEMASAPAALRGMIGLRVVYDLPDPAGGHLLGGEFATPLSAADVQMLLATP